MNRVNFQKLNDGDTFKFDSRWWKKISNGCYNAELTTGGGLAFLTSLAVVLVEECLMLLALAKSGKLSGGRIAVRIY